MKNNSGAKAQNQKGNKLKEEGKLEEAIACYQKAIEINPQLALSYFNLGRALVEKEKFDEAIEAYRKAIEINPKPPKFHQHLKDALQQKKPALNKDKNLDLPAVIKKFNSLKYRGQLLQDKWVVMMTQGKQKGVFLEIGSSDGVGLNNTFCLEKKFSWSGMCVEPNPDLFKKLCANRTAITLPYAFSKESGEIIEFVPHGVFGTIAKYSSADGHAAKRENFISENGTIKVLTARPDLILELYKFPENFDFLSLDVEGAELEVLESFNLSKWQPALACIEHNHIEDRRFAIFKLLSSHGYQCLQIQFDDWYYHPDILKILNPDIPLSYYQEVIEYFCQNHKGKLMKRESFKGDKKNKLIIELAKFIEPQEFNNAEVELFDSQEARMAYLVAKKFNLEGENLKEFQIYQLLAETLTNKGELEGAIACYEKTIELQPNLWGVYQKLADIYWQQGQLSTAVATIEKGIALNPDFSWFYHKLGLILLELQQWEKAANVLEKAVKLNPDFYASYEKLGEALSKLENWSGAVATYKNAAKIKALSYWGENKLGEALIKLDEFEEAIAAFNNAIKLNPNFSWTPYHLAEVLGKLQRWEEAAIAYEKAWDLQSDKKLFAQKLESALQKQNKEEKLIAFYRKYLEINPDEWRYYRSLGDIYIKNENWQEAIACFINALQFELDCPPAYRKLAEILEKQGNKRAAYRCQYHHILPQNLLIKYCNLNKDSIVESSQESNINYQKIYDASFIKLTPSKTIETKVFGGLRSPHINSSKAFIAVIPEARAWAKNSISAIITSDNKLVTDLSLGNAELILSSSNLPDARYFDKTVAFLSLKWEQCGYFNWMFNVIARFDLLRRSGINLSEIDKFAVNKAQSKFQIETLKIVGVAEDKIIESESTPYLKAKRLIVPSIPAKAANGFRSSKWACDFLKSQFLNPELTNKLPFKQERIYVSRKMASRRRIINEEEVVNLLEKYGFRRVILESMSVAEQALCMANAKIVVAPHGAGLANLVFCNPETKVIEIFSPKSIINTYWLLSNVCELEHYYLLGEIFDDSYFSNPGCKDILVNLDSLLKLIKLAGIA